MKHLWTLIVLLLGVFLLGFGGIQAGYNTATEPYTVTGESATVDYDSEYTVAESGTAESFNDSIMVSVDGSQLDAGEDYEWHPSRGAVEWLNSTATESGDTALVDYEYMDHPEASQYGFNMFYLVLFVIAFMMVYVAYKWILGGI